MEIAKARKIFLVAFYIFLSISIGILAVHIIDWSNDGMTSTALSIGGYQQLANAYNKTIFDFLFGYLGSAAPVFPLLFGSLWLYLRADKILKNVKCPECRSLIPRDASTCGNCGCKLIKQ
jgi:hypothetical protein